MSLTSARLLNKDGTPKHLVVFDNKDWPGVLVLGPTVYERHENAVDWVEATVVVLAHSQIKENL